MLFHFPALGSPVMSWKGLTTPSLFLYAAPMSQSIEVECWPKTTDDVENA